ncbi:MAG: hypothetical protein ACK50D_13645 [Burkholderiales bacterium]
MPKIVDILNADVGEVATKVLKADVGDIVKGAGKVLTTDVGTIAKGTSKVLSYDLADLFSDEKQDADAAAPKPAGTYPTPPAPGTTPAPNNEPPPPGSTASFTAVKPAATPGELPKMRLTEALVMRQSRPAPAQAELTILLPLAIGAYERALGSAHGDIASDPVSVMYSGNGEAVSVTVTPFWESDEAQAALAKSKNALENSRGSVEQSWIAGIDSRGVVFMWTRDTYCFEITSPRGVSPVARFLEVFPY